MENDEPLQKVHHLRSWPHYFQPIFDGLKTFEVRYNDRDYKEGDILHLMEYNPDGKGYSTRNVYRYVTHILSDDFKGVAKGWVVMSIRPVLIDDVRRPNRCNVG